MGGETIVAICAAVIAAGSAGVAWKQARRANDAAERSAGADERSAAAAERIVNIEERRDVETQTERQRTAIPRLDLGDLHKGFWTMNGAGHEPSSIDGTIQNHGPGLVFIHDVAIEIATADHRDQFDQSRPLPAGELYHVELAWNGHPFSGSFSLVVTFTVPETQSRFRASFPMFVTGEDQIGWPFWQAAGPNVVRA